MEDNKNKISVVYKLGYLLGGILFICSSVCVIAVTIAFVRWLLF